MRIALRKAVRETYRCSDLSSCAGSSGYLTISRTQAEIPPTLTVVRKLFADK